MSNKEKIIRDLEYISGGITAFKCVCQTGRDDRFYRLIDEWQDTIYSIMDMIEEDYEVCQKPLTNLQN